MIKKALPYFIIFSALILVGFGFKYKLFNPSSGNSLSLKNSQSNICAKSRVTIQNGCGINNLGRIYKKYLLSQKYDVDQFIDASHFGHSSTVIHFHKNNKNCALKLAKKLGINSNQIEEKTNLNYYHDLTLILGKDYNTLKSYNQVKKYNPFQ